MYAVVLVSAVPRVPAIPCSVSSLLTWFLPRSLRVAFIGVLSVGLLGNPPEALFAQQDPTVYVPPTPRADRKAEKHRRELGIIAEPLGSLQPCERLEGPNFVNFVSRGRTTGEATYLYGIDLCTRRPFVYREPTRAGAIVGFDANPPRILWADDPADSRNLRGDRFAFELLLGLESVNTIASVDLGQSVDRISDVAFAPSVGVLFSRIRLVFSHGLLPRDNTWLTKLAFMPFRKGATRKRYDPLPSSRARPGAVTYFDPVKDPCNATNIGIRGVDRFRLGERGRDGFPVTLEMVSYCQSEYAHYSVRTQSRLSYFSQFNNTFPQFADWGEIPRGGLLSSLAVIVGYGEVDHDLGRSDFSTRVIFAGLGISLGDSRWYLDVGRTFSLDSLDIPNGLEPIHVTVSGWAVHLQRALHLSALGL